MEELRQCARLQVCILSVISSGAAGDTLTKRGRFDKWGRQGVPRPRLEKEGPQTRANYSCILPRMVSKCDSKVASTLWFDSMICASNVHSVSCETIDNQGWTQTATHTSINDVDVCQNVCFLIRSLLSPVWAKEF